MTAIECPARHRRECRRSDELFELAPPEEVLSNSFELAPALEDNPAEIPTILKRSVSEFPDAGGHHEDLCVLILNINALNAFHFWKHAILRIRASDSELLVRHRDMFGKNHLSQRCTREAEQPDFSKSLVQLNVLQLFAVGECFVFNYL